MAPPLYEDPLSSDARKVEIAPREKGVPFRAERPEGFGAGGLPVVEAGLRDRNIRFSWPDAEDA